MHDQKSVGMMSRVRRAMLEAWRDGWMSGRLWFITTSPEEARALHAEFPRARLVLVRASLDDIAKRIEARHWLTHEQRNDMLAAARNIVAAIDASGLRSGD